MFQFSHLTYWLPLCIGVVSLLSAGVTGHHGHGHGGHGHGAHHHGAHHHHAHPAGKAGYGIAALHAVLEFFGFGRAPGLIVVSCILLGWGLSGVLATQLLHEGRAAVAVAAVGAVALCRLVSGVLARILPEDESYAATRDDFIGLSGRVVYTVKENGGRIHVYDKVHTLHDKFARTPLGHAPIPANTPVRVIDVDPETGDLIVDRVGAYGS